MKKSIQTGFSIVELLVVFVIVGVIGFAGYTVATRQDSVDESTQSAAESTLNNEDASKEQGNDEAIQVDEIKDASGLSQTENLLEEVNLEELDTTELDSAEAELL